MEVERNQEQNTVEASVKTVFKFKMHTIILLVGPSGAGKTKFSHEQLIPQLKANATSKKTINVQYIGSDDIRRQLLGDPDADKMSREMMHVSHQAFDVLFNRLKNVTTYPVNADFVIVDTTGLNKDFRESIIKLAHDNNYSIAAILFNYKKRDEYYDGIKGGPESIRVTSKQLDEFKFRTLREITKKNYSVIEEVKSRDFSKIEISVEDYDLYNSHVLPVGPEYVVIGDVHGCYKELVELIEKNGFSISDEGYISVVGNKELVFVGDLIDKGYAIEKVIEFIHKNLSVLKIVIGNHENFVYKWLKGMIPTKSAPPLEVIQDYFNTVYILEMNEELKQKFFEIVEASKGFYVHRDFIVTHAPCEVKYLGKIGSKSLKAQRDIRYPKSRDFAKEEDFMDAMYKSFDFLKKEAHTNQPIHIFGHIMTKNVARIGNKMNIDTGCVAGGKLTSVVINPHGKPFMLSVSSAENEKINKADLKDFLPHKEKEFDLSDLEPSERGRIFYAAEGKINFVSGTVCPADADKENNNIESLQKAFDYYRGCKIETVVLQPKYMGSRANVYLFRDPSKNYTTSRNGYRIKQIDLTEAYKSLYDIPYIRARFEKGMEMILLDAELMPWSAIGKGLIEREFYTIESAIKTELEFLKNEGFEEALDNYVKNHYEPSDYKSNSHKKTNAEMKAIYGDARERNFRNLKQFLMSYNSMENSSKNLSVFSKQLELYATDKPIHFKPFSILKEIDLDGTETLFFESTNEFVYKAVSEDKFIVVDLNNPSDIAVAMEFYKDVTENQEMEGVMVKPLKIYNKGVAPCLKVRNPNYLTIVYGPDYLRENKLEKLIDRKSIKGKLRASIEEFEIGKQLLQIPYNDISKENPLYVKLFAKMILEEKKEQALDPRL